MTKTEAPNYINHIALVVDASSSMTYHSSAVVKVADNLITTLAERSKHWDQETRITVYKFSSERYCDGSWIQCLVYDKDVLRVPSIAGRYHAIGNTALLDATAKAIDDLALTPEIWGEHAFLIYVLTDGQENQSRLMRADGLRDKIARLPGHWTLACFVPDKHAEFEAKKFGFPAENIAVWNTASATGLEEVGKIIRDTSEAFMEARSQGIRDFRARGGVFAMKNVSAADVKRTLTPLTRGSYALITASADQRIDEFVQEHARRPYYAGVAYYEFDLSLKPSEKIQASKKFAIETGGDVYTGPAARQLLGLPDYEVRAKDIADHPGCTIFVQSSSYNRKILAGQKVLIMR